MSSEDASVAPTWARYDSGEHGFSLARPDDWVEAEDLLGTAVAFVAPEIVPEGFLANFNILVIEGEAVPDDDLPGLTAGELAASLVDVMIIEQELTELADRPAAHVLASHRENQWALTLEQWVVALGDRRLVLSATSDTADYAAMADTFEAIADSLELDG